MEICTQDAPEDPAQWNFVAFNEYFNQIIPLGNLAIKKENIETITKEKFTEDILKIATKMYEAKEKEIGSPERMREIERVIMLKVIDSKWMDHIDDMDRMRQGIGLQAYGQRDPLIEYKYVSYDMFNELSFNIQQETVRGLYHVRVVAEPKREDIEQKQMFTNKDDTLGAKPKVRKDDKVGRNDPCPCGSGKKYKQCCGR